MSFRISTNPHPCPVTLVLTYQDIGDADIEALSTAGPSGSPAVPALQV